MTSPATPSSAHAGRARRRPSRRLLPVGGRARVQVPATTANLGPGFDAFGLALALHDQVDVEVVATGVDVQVQGEGSATVARDGSHLVVRALRTAVEDAGWQLPGLRLTCRNAIPHGRGMGSSAAAVVAGVRAARALVEQTGAVLPVGWELSVASAMEGHPDNAAAALAGGLTLAWTDRGTASAVRLEVDPRLRPLVVLAERPLSTSRARSMLPDLVPHADAAFNLARSALLVEAVCRRPDLLMVATQDRLHQQQRAPAAPVTAALTGSLRELGLAAAVSGAGPSLLVLTVHGQRVQGRDARAVVEAEVARRAGPGWRVLDPGVDIVGALVLDDDPRAELTRP